jgi:hypothetical protein
LVFLVTSFIVFFKKELGIIELDSLFAFICRGAKHWGAVVWSGHSLVVFLCVWLYIDQRVIFLSVSFFLISFSHNVSSNKFIGNQ